MAAYRIEFLSAAAKDLAALPRDVQRAVSAAVDALAEQPRPTGSKKLEGADDLHRIRVKRDYRVIYQIRDRVLVVVVVRVRHRREAYRGL